MALGLLAAAALVGIASACEPGVSEGRIEVLETLPHDPEAFTQGLLFHEGHLLESTGRYGESDVRRVDPATGEVLQLTPLPDSLFGEGLALMPAGELVQITWRERVALVYDPETLELVRSERWDTDGWGLCYADGVLLSTSGGSILLRHDPATLEARGHVQITRDGTPLYGVNELECVDGLIYGNVFEMDVIVVVEPESGEVVREFDASALRPESARGREAVLNGIAYDEATDTFYLTGKLWPVTYRVRLLPE